MSKKVPLELLTSEVFLSSSEAAKRVSRGVREGTLRKIGPRLYTTRVGENPEAVVRRNVWHIVALYVPGGVVGYRTALEGKPAADGAVFVSSNTKRDIDLPGLRIRALPGPGPLDGDMPFVGGLFMASRARALLEVLRPSRQRDVTARGYRREEVERWLERQLQIAGEAELNRLRDAMRCLALGDGSVAGAMDGAEELAVADGVIGTLLGTRQQQLTDATARARADGRPYDVHRIALMQELHAALTRMVFPEIPDPAAGGGALRNLAFLDAYFSNYIEGTTFEVGEAREIVFEGKVMETRPADAHDVLGTFELVSDPGFLRTRVADLADADAFVARLRDANARVMRARPEKRPGKIKERQNQAGNTVFVEPTLVLGTLQEGLAYVRALEHAFARAVALMFLVSEVHPFADGNGRVARAIMNAELVSAGQCRVLIPTVYRDDYITALRTMTRQQHPAPLIEVLAFAQRVTSRVDYRDLDGAIATLRRCRAFDEPDEGVKLRMPEENP